MSKLSRAVGSYRRQLLIGEQAAATEVFEAYNGVYQRLVRELHILFAQIQREEALGNEITPNNIYRRTRLESFLNITRAEIDRWALNAEAQIVAQRAEAIRLSDEAAQELIRQSMGPVPEGFIYTPEFTQFNPRTVTEMLARYSQTSPLRSLIQSIAPTTTNDVQQTFLKGILGKNPRALQRELAQTLHAPRHRALTILRTEVIGAYRETNIETYRQKKRVVKKWRWTCALNARTCGMCLAMDGREFPVETSFGSHPNCRCVPTPVPVSWKELGIDLPDSRTKLPLGKDWFDRQNRVTKLRILGPSKLEALEKGEFEFMDLIGYRVHPEWGPNRWERSLTAIKEERDIPPKSALGTPDSVT